MDKGSRVLAWVLLTSLLCAPILRGASPPGAGERVVIGVRADADTFNIYTAATILAQEISDLLFLHLATEQADFDKGPPSFAPAIAKSWEFSTDGLTLTARLDPAARWSDDRPVTAADVLFSHRAAVSEEVGWVGRDTKESILSVESPDELTVRYRFARRHPYQMMDASEGNILPAHHYGTIPFAAWPKTSFTDAPVVSGPYRLVSYRPGETIELARNRRYAGPPAGIDRVVFRVIPDETTQLAELETGGIDVMENLPPRDVARLAASPALKLTTLHDLSYTYVCWNTRSPLFSDATVRRALTMAIDRRVIIDGLLFGMGRTAASPIISLFWAHDASLEPWPFDPAGARDLLARAGWRDGDGDGVLERDGRPFRFTLETNQGSRLRNDVALMVREHLRKVGVDAVPQVIEFAAFVAKHERHEFDAFIGAQREATRVDPKSLLHSAAVRDGYNYGSYASADMDRLIDEARAEPDTTRARAIWFRAQRLFHEDQPITILFERLRVNATSRRVTGAVMTPRSALAGLPAWRLDPAGKEPAGRGAAGKGAAGR